MRIAYVDHQRLSDLVGHAARRAHGLEIVGTRIVFAASDLDSDDDIGVLFRHAERRGNVDHPHVHEFAGLADQSDSRDVEKRENPCT